MTSSVVLRDLGSHSESSTIPCHLPVCLAPPVAVAAPTEGTSCQGWDGLGGAASWYCAARGLMLVFQLHSHLSLLLVSGTQGREVSILIFISGIGLCLLCRCLAPPCLSPCASIPLAVQRSRDPREGQGCPPACKPFPSTGGDNSLPPCVVCPVLPCWGQGVSREGGQRRWRSGCEPALTPASAGLPGHKVGHHTAIGAQHTPTLTSLSSFCSPDEDSCQKFVPFVGVSVLRGQQGLWGEGSPAQSC